MMKINKSVLNYTVIPYVKVLKNNKIKIYEMFMRDGLQSLKPYKLEQKKLFLNQIMKNKYHCVEFGSTTNSKLLPQMENSYELWNYIYNNNENSKTKFTMLTPNNLNECKLSGIKSFGLVCSISDNFAQSNLKKSADESIERLFKQLDDVIMLPDYHVRLYISCSFGELPDGNLNEQSKIRLYNFLDTVNKKINENYIETYNLDIVLSDTIGSVNESKLDEILNNVDKNLIDYIALHLHSDKNFYPIINKALEYNISKFDSSLLGIGGCPFSEKKTVGNISTYSLVKYLHSKGYNTDLSLTKLKETQENIKLLMKSFN